MINQHLPPSSLIDISSVDPKEEGAEFWYEAYLKLKQENTELKTKLSAVEKELAELQILDFGFWILDFGLVMS